MSTAEEALNALSKHAADNFNRLLKEGWVENEAAEFQNVDTLHSVATLKNGTDTERFVFKGGECDLWAKNFAQALIETCEYGNAEAQPFVVSVNKHWSAVTHKGALRHGKWHSTQGEARQSMKKAMPLAPRLSAEEIEQRKRDWLLKRINDGKLIIRNWQLEAERKLKEEAEQQAAQGEMIASGFGAW